MGTGSAVRKETDWPEEDWGRTGRQNRSGVWGSRMDVKYLIEEQLHVKQAGRNIEGDGGHSCESKALSTKETMERPG